MSASPAFAALTEALENASHLDRHEARGTVRLALKRAGLDAGSVIASELQVVIDKILPAELQRRGVDEDVCARLTSAITALPAQDRSAADSPEAVFQRLGG